MALGTPTLLDTAIGTSQASTIVSSSISPTGDALLIVSASVIDTAVTDITGVTDTLSGTGTWTKQTDNVGTTPHDFNQDVWTAKAGSSPGSGTITVTFSGNANRRSMCVAEVTGQDTSSPVAQSKNGAVTSGTDLTITLDSSPASDAATFGAVVCNSVIPVTFSPGSGFTEIADFGMAVSPDLVHQMEYDTSTPDTEVDWSRSQAENRDMMGGAIEISAAAAGDGLASLAGNLRKKNQQPLLVR